MTFFPRNKFLDAAAKTILLFGVLHVFVLLAVFLKTGDLSLFNIARMLELNFILSVNIDGAMYNSISLLFIDLLYSILYLLFTI